MNRATKVFAGLWKMSSGVPVCSILARTQDDDAVGQCHRLDLVVGDIDDRGLHLPVQALDFRAHLGAQLGIEIGERLVEQEDIGMTNDGAAHSDPLTLASGELARLAVEQAVESQNVGGFL